MLLESKWKIKYDLLHKLDCLKSGSETLIIASSHPTDELLLEGEQQRL